MRAHLCTRYIIGIDEVGRGCLAGPVVAAVFCIPKGINIRDKDIGKLRDSKKLTPRRRELWFNFFKGHPKAKYAIARVYPATIDRINISMAANLAARRAFLRLAKTHNLKPKTCAVYLDGGLYLGSRKEQMANGKWNAKTIVRGDEKIKVVAMASIVAKVLRDRAMTRLAKEFPQYKFEVHKGYGTKAHFKAIKKHGPSEAHRLTFIRFSRKIRATGE